MSGGTVKCPNCGTLQEWKEPGKPQACWACGTLISAAPPPDQWKAKRPFQQQALDNAGHPTDKAVPPSSAAPAKLKHPRKAGGVKAPSPRLPTGAHAHPLFPNLLFWVQFLLLVAWFGLGVWLITTRHSLPGFLVLLMLFLYTLSRLPSSS